MKYDKRDLMNEGWNAMESLLNEEMPTKTKDHNYMLIGLLVLFAFSGGLWLGTSLPSNNQNAVVEESLTAQNTHSDILVGAQTAQAKATSKNALQKVFSKIIERAKNSKIVRNNISPRKESSTESPSVSSVAYNESSKQNSNINSQDILSSDESITEITSKPEVSTFDEVSILTQEELLSEALAVSYLPRSNSKVKKPTNWVLGLGLSSGINPGRNTKVASLKSEWMYKVGNQNAIGLEFIYAAEDRFGFLNFGDSVEEEPGRAPKEEESGRENVESLIQNSRQFRYAAGLVVQQDFGFRFYSNLSAGINVMQNSYSNELAYKSLNRIDNIKYHWGGYTSLAFGYRISKLVDFEISGTKSLLVRDNNRYQRGSTDQIVGGIKISF